MGNKRECWIFWCLYVNLDEHTCLGRFVWLCFQSFENIHQSLRKQTVGVSWIAYDSQYFSNENRLIQSGIAATSKALQGYKLATGTGSRKQVLNVKFPKAFSSIPHILLGLSQFEFENSNKQRDMRIACAANNITKYGFDIEVRLIFFRKISEFIHLLTFFFVCLFFSNLKFDTWNNTWIYGVSCNWLAFEASFGTSPTSSIRMLTNKQPFKKDHPDFRLYDGTGSRQIRRTIPFSPNFHSTPHVITTQYMIDIIAQEKKNSKNQKNSKKSKKSNGREIIFLKQINKINK